MPFLIGLCQSATALVPPSVGVAAALALAGLVGSAAHCAPMCGPFVLAQCNNVPGTGWSLHRIAGAALLPYHLGRLTVYAGLGALAGAAGNGLADLAAGRPLLSALLLLAAAAFLLRGITTLLPHVAAPSTGRLGAQIGAWLARGIAPILRGAGALRGYGLGLALGFLPCGFLYAALLAAGATGDPAAGALGMAAFGLGTMPALLLVAFGGRLVTQRWRHLATVISGPVFLANAVVLTVLAIGGLT
jgi:sulfite exporter TauE/SafE